MISVQRGMGRYCALSGVALIAGGVSADGSLLLFLLGVAALTGGCVMWESGEDE